MANIYMNNLRHEINQACPGILDDANMIYRIPESSSYKLIEILLSHACESQNIGAIVSARELIRNLPPAWLAAVLPNSVEKKIDLSDEWQYRRLVELLQELKSELLVAYIGYGLASNINEIREAAADYSNTQLPPNPLRPL
ncbi:hypothetical protein R5W23_001810 [Gemmata sp. JC673]|uniref:Uncharacterized protein n=1 Tax=Gemmata algarum TaxID=2975278 RepID=A0ABU5EZH0_9BACT|nr:hypothetical protein [Gemmata algarum]MDY3560566.1 hypothetical protein [Gemmata algarum]